jgi:hypothetical protein
MGLADTDTPAHHHCCISNKRLPKKRSSSLLKNTSNIPNLSLKNLGENEGNYLSGN